MPGSKECLILLVLAGNDFSSKMGNSEIIKSLLDCLQATLLFNFIIFVTAWILSQHDRSVIVFVSLSATFIFFLPSPYSRHCLHFVFCSKHAVGTQETIKTNHSHQPLSVILRALVKPASAERSFACSMIELCSQHCMLWFLTWSWG